MENPWITYSGYILALLALLGNFWQYWIKRKDDEKRDLREKRYNICTEYFSKVDRVNTQLYQAQLSEELQEEMMEFMDLLTKVSSGGTPEQALEVHQRYTSVMGKYSRTLAVWVKEQNILLDEINKVRLIASEEVAVLLERYGKAIEKIAESSIGLPIEMALGGLGQMDWGLVLNYGQLMEELKSIKSELYTAMRKDMGVV